MSDQDVKDFPFPLNQDIEEQVPVRKISVDEIDEKAGTAKFSVKTVLEKQTVRYIHAPKSKARCKDGEHIFRVYHAKKGLFACTHCPYVRKVYPSTYMFKDGKLIHRHTGRVI